MQVILLLAVLAALTISDLRPSEPATSSVVSVGLTVMALLLQVGFAAGISWVVCRRLQRDDVPRGPLLKWFGRLRLMHLLLWLGFSAAVYVLFDWGRVVRYNWGLRQVPVLEDLLLFLPLLLPWLGSVLLFYEVECAVRCQVAARTGTKAQLWTQREFLSFQLRHNLGIVLIPLLLLLAVEDSLNWLAPQFMQSDWSWVVFVLPLAGVFLTFPLLLKHLWETHSLPEGPLRERLEATSSRLGLTIRDILIWRTGSVVGNAAVVGFLPNLRYVFLTDALVGVLDDDEIEAVFGHEAGHVLLQHMFLRVLTILAPLGLWSLVKHGFPGLVAAASGHLEGWGLDPSEQAALLMIIGMSVYIPLVFTYLSRQLEVQADLFGCRTVSDDITQQDGRTTYGTLRAAGVEIFSSALEKLARLNGISRHTGGWQHYSIARRVELLREMVHDPAREARFERRLRVLRFAVLAVIFGGLVCQFLG